MVSRRSIQSDANFGRVAEALEVIPRTLAENAGKKPSQVISELYAAHKRGEGCVGVDVDGTGVEMAPDGDGGYAPRKPAAADADAVAAASAAAEAERAARLARRGAAAGELLAHARRRRRDILLRQDLHAAPPPLPLCSSWRPRSSPTTPGSA